MKNAGAASLSPAQIERFVTEGFVCLDEAFPFELAATCREKPMHPASPVERAIQLALAQD